METFSIFAKWHIQSYGYVQVKIRFKSGKMVILQLKVNKFNLKMFLSLNIKLLSRQSVPIHTFIHRVCAYFTDFSPASNVF